MAHQIFFKGVVLTVPGVASFTDASRLATAGLSGLGVVGIVGEATGGEGFDQNTIHLVTRANADAAKDVFRSGPIVDAISNAFAPANDSAIPGGASALQIVQVKKPTQSTLTVDENNAVPVQSLITLTSTLFGVAANLLSATVASVVSGAGTGRVVSIQFDTDDPIVSPTLAIQDSGSNDDVALTINYTGDGTTGVMVLTETTLTTTLAGDQTDGSVNLALTLADYTSLQSLVDFINTQTGYAAVAIRPDADVFDSADLDHVGNTAPVDIKTGVVKLYSSVFDVVEWITANTDLVTAAVAALAAEDETQLGVLTKTNLAGATAGAATSNSDWQSSFDLLKTVDLEHVVPLISADAGSVTIASVNSQADAHAAEMSNPGGNSERMAWLSIQGNKAAVKAEAQRINSFHSSVSGQELQLLDSTGGLEFLEEWSLALTGACSRAGMADEGEPLTRKFLRASGVRQDASWDPKIDAEEMLLAGVFFVENVPGSGVRFVKGVTSYTKKDNLALIDENQVWEWKQVQKRVRNSLEDKFVGKKAAVPTIVAVKQEIVAALERERGAGTITDSVLEDGTVERAFTNPIVSFQGGTVRYEYGVKVTPGINFLTGVQFLEPVVITV